MKKAASKKAVSLVASFALAFSLLGAPAVGFAAESDGNADALRTLQQTAATAPITKISSGASRDAGTGSVEVRTTMLLAHESIIGSMEAKLFAGDGQEPVKSVAFKAKAQDDLSETGSTATLEEVPTGDYVLRVEGPGFVSFSQSVTVTDGERSVVNLVDRFSELTCIDEATGTEMSVDEFAGRGLIPYGNFNGDDAIDSTDARMMLDAIAAVRARGDEGPTAEEQQRYGLNLVREVDAPATVAEGGEDVEPGSTDKVKNTEPIPVGLNAFQKLASLAGSQAKAGKARSVKETKNMAATADESISVTTSGSSSLKEALFADNGELVTMAHKDENAEISVENPVSLTIDANDTPMGAVTIAVPSDSPNAPTQGQVIVETSDGDQLTYNFSAPGVEGRTSGVVDMRANLFAAAGERATYFADSTKNATVSKTGDLITVDLSSNGVAQVPVKVITIKVTATSSKKLAEIAQVEFLNGMEDKIPEPELDVPTKLVATPASKSIALTWEPQRNVTGYEVEISYKGASTVQATTKNEATIGSLAGKELVNYRTYTLRVRSTNGDWRSPWSAAIEATPQATSKPMAPKAPNVKGNYNSLSVSWSQALDAETHSVYYKKSTDKDYIRFLEKTDQLSCTIPNLELSTSYDVVITGVNVHGEGPRSPASSAITTPNQVKVPWYKLINRAAQNNVQGTNHPTNIQSVTGDNGSSASNDPNAMVDGNYDTYYSGKEGGYTHGGTVEFTQPYSMDTIVLTGYQGQPLNSYHMEVQAWDADGNEIKPNGESIKFNTIWLDRDTQTLLIRTSKLDNAKKVRVAYERSVGTSWSASTIAELAFYDTTLYSDVMGLWADEEHTTLKPEVTIDTINALRTEVNTADPLCDEHHPSQSLLIAELENAETVCNNKGLRAATKVDPKLNTNAKLAKRGVGGLNGWQPLGTAVKAGDEVAIYVGKKGETDRDVPLAIHVVQNHPDISNGFSARLQTAEGGNVKVGLNTFIVPDLTSMNMERGGSLYVEYSTASNSTDQYVVRVSGGSSIPVLDLHEVTDEGERTQRIRAYVEEIASYDPAAEHGKYNHVTPVNDTAYHEQDCIANATDIVLADIMYSIPVSGVKKELGVANGGDSAAIEAGTQKLAKALKAGDDMMRLFYQHKGFVKDATAGTTYGTNNAWPTLHQNIRYVRCSGNVFMYAAGNHVGIQWGSEGNLVNCGGVTLDANGKWQDGVYFGWGVAHELGHEINQGAYTYAEVTNNYYSQLTQATDDLDMPRIRWQSYDKVYDRVTSGAKGAASGGTGIAMYWQLHLAYDDGYNYETYDTAASMYENLVFARIDAYARNVASAPVADNAKARALTLTKFDEGANSKDNSLMRLACAATQKNLLSFFEAWGLTPDSETVAYAEQWPVEERAIQYQSEALRLYRIGDFSQLSQPEHGGLTTKQPEGEALKARVTPTLEYTKIADRPNTTTDQSIKVKLSGASTNKEILGYEVLRNGEPVGFLRANDFEGGTSAFTDGEATFVDTINTVNNRVFSYSVRAVDKLLGYGEEISAGQVKVSHKNSLSKKKWTATTNMTSGESGPNETQAPTPVDPDGAGMCDPDASSSMDEHPVKQVIDGDDATVFSGTASGDARVTLNFNEPLTVVGMQYIPSTNQPISAYEIQTSMSGTEGDWQTVASGTFAFDGDGKATVYFERGDDQYLYGHDACYLRLVATGQGSAIIGEINVLGPQGDDAEFLTNGIGLLDQDEELGTTESGVSARIPAGSLVFVGTYTGNPAYNALLLFDQDGNIVGGTGADGSINAKEVIFAPPLGEDANLGDVKEGFWVYYIEPQYLTGDWQSKLQSVKAELYRVDDAHTLEGQRLVADTLSVSMPADLHDIDLSFGQIPTTEDGDDQQDQARSADEQGQVPADGQQSAGTPIEGEDVARTAHGVDGAAPLTDPTIPSDAMGVPIYASDAPMEMGTMGAPTEAGDGALGTPIYDDATPLAAPHGTSLMKMTLKKVCGSLGEALKAANLPSVAATLV